LLAAGLAFRTFSSIICNGLFGLSFRIGLISFLHLRFRQKLHNTDKNSTEKSLQKPQCDNVDEVTIANQNTPSTLLEADVVNLSDHDDATDGIIDNYDFYCDVNELLFLQLYKIGLELTVCECRI
jgi:hypothetical protein